MFRARATALFRCILALTGRAVLAASFLIGFSCVLAWAGSQQPTRTSRQNEASNSLKVAIDYAKAGKWEQAASLLRPFVKRDPQQREAWLWLGYSEFNLHRFAEATYAFQQAVRFSPQDANAYYHLGLSFLEMGRPYKAYQAWITTLKLDPRNSVVPYFIGRLMVDEGRLTEAEKWLEKVDESSPMRYRATYYLGFCNEKLGRLDEAIKLYRQSLQECVRSGKTFSSPYTRLAMVLMRKKADSEARKILQEGVRRSPDGNLLTTYGELLVREHDYDNAKTFLTRASEMDPSLPDPHYILGRLMTKLGQTSKAQQEFKAYRELKSRQLSGWEDRHLSQALQFDKYLVMTRPTKEGSDSPDKNTSQ